MTIAILDLGTNTFHCLIVNKTKDKQFSKVYKTKSSVKLGEGGFNKGIIAPLPFKRGIVALRMFAEVIKKHKVDHVVAFGTAALRNADNANEFIEIAKKETGIEISIISGEEEAEYIYYGVKHALDLGNERSLIMDIGGGSVEFLIADEEKIHWMKSYDAGAALLLDKFMPADPIALSEIKNIEKFLSHEFIEVFENVSKHKVKTLVGSSGSFDTFAEMIAHRFYTPKILKGKTEYDFNMNEFQQIHEHLMKSTAKERLHTKGIVAMRVDMIVLASIMVNLVLTKTGIRNMKLSSYALKEGMLWQISSEKMNITLD